MIVCAATTVQLCIAAFWRILSNWTLKIGRAMYVGIGLTLMLFWHQSKRYHILTKTRLSFFRFPKLNFF